MTGSGEAGSFLLPTGTVAFLLTDVEGSTRLWEAEADAMAAAMERHNAIVDVAVSAHGGVSPPAQGEGDSIVAAFARPSDAVLAARDAQAALAAEPWPTSSPLRVRMAVHAGEARFIDDGNYAGQAIVRTARLRAITHGGQVLVSASARDLTIDHLGDRVSFRDLGEHRLRDLARPEHVYQLTGGGLPEDFPGLPSLDTHPHNLPIQLSTFVGREAEIAKLVALVGTNRLVTIAGTGGAGKTRLAQQVAAELVDAHPDGVWWVELAEVNDPGLIAASISGTVGVRGEVGEGAAQALAERIGDRRALLVLDNCEHLVAPVAVLVDHLLRHCGGTSVLCTSREPLEVAGEIAWRIPPLTVPVEADRLAIGTLPQFDSVRLFLDRAQAVRPNFHLSDDNGPVVAAICARLDGIPLAIELASARCRSLSPEQVLAGLTDVFHLLTGGGRTALPRQQTLEASIAWSHDLLAEDERVLLRRISVFNGGATLDDAEVVVADDALARHRVLDVLDRLVAQSLVHLDDTGPVPRHRLLETVRQYAARRLDEAGEAEGLRRRHAEHFVAVAEAIGQAVEGRDELAGYARVVAERDNLGSALSWLLSAGRWEDAARLVLGCAWARLVTDPTQSARDLSTALDGAPDGSAFAAPLLAVRAMTHAVLSDAVASDEDVARAVASAEVLGDDRSAGRAKVAFGLTGMIAGSPAHLTALAEAREHAARAGDAYCGAYVDTIEAMFTITALGTRPADWELFARAEASVAQQGSAYLRSLLHASGAWGLSMQGRFSEATVRFELAEDGLADLARALRLPVDHLVRSSMLGNVLLFLRTTQAMAGIGRLEYKKTRALVDASRAEGGQYLSTMVAGMLALARGSWDPAGAIRDLEEIAEESWAVGAVQAAALASNHAAGLHHGLGDSAAARALLERCDPVADDLGPYMVSRHNLRWAALALDAGEVAEAEQRGHRSLELTADNDLAWELAMSLELLCAVAASTAAPVEAVRVAAGAARLRADRVPVPHLNGEGERLEAALARARAELGDEAYEAAWTDGYARSVEEVVEYVRRSRGERKRPTHGWESLTPTEQQVVEQVALGLTNPEIGEQLLMGRSTVKTHLARVFQKLGVKSRSELAAAVTRRSADG